MTRYRKEMEEAREMLEQVDQMDYNQLRAKGAGVKGTTVDPESTRPIAGQLKQDIIRIKKQGGENPTNDIFEGKNEEERDKLVLS